MCRVGFAGPSPCAEARWLTCQELLPVRCTVSIHSSQMSTSSSRGFAESGGRHDHAGYARVSSFVRLRPESELDMQIVIQPWAQLEQVADRTALGRRSQGRLVGRGYPVAALSLGDFAGLGELRERRAAAATPQPGALARSPAVIASSIESAARTLALVGPVAARARAAGLHAPGRSSGSLVHVKLLRFPRRCWQPLTPSAPRPSVWPSQQRASASAAPAPGSPASRSPASRSPASVPVMGQARRASDWIFLDVLTNPTEQR
jgi:hypothetical protein